MIRNKNYVVSKTVLNVPSHLNFGRYVLDVLNKHGDKIALTNGVTHRSITHKEIVRKAMSIAVSLARLGVTEKDVVSVCMENKEDFWPIIIGVSCTGAAVNPVSVGYTADELKLVLNITKPKYMFCTNTSYKNHEKTLSRLPYLKKVIVVDALVKGTVCYEDLVKDEVDFGDFEPVDVKGQSDTLFVLFSSGTTGLPKGVMLTHLNVIATCSLETAMNPEFSSLFITPWSHTMGLMGVLRNLIAGGVMVHLPKYETDLYLKTIERYKIQQLILAPPVLVATSKSQTQCDLTSVRYIYSGAAPLRKDTIEQAKKKFPNVSAIMQGYGMTESTLAVTRDVFHKAHSAKPGGVGFVVSNCIIKVIDIETGKVLGPNQPGEIRIKGPMVMKGYIGKNRSDDFDDEGFYRTGDIGYYDDDCYFFIVDRLKELIKYKGYQVPPAEIESVLLQHPGVADAGVAGAPHAAGGEAPRAFVVRRPGATLTEGDVHAFVKEKLSNPKQLRGGVQFVKEIPKNPSGKILRRKLKEMAAGKSKL